MSVNAIFRYREIFRAYNQSRLQVLAGRYVDFFRSR